MRISFTLTKEYEIFIDKEAIDKLYGGDIKRAVIDGFKDAKEVDSYDSDVSILDTDLDAQDVLYDEALQDEYEREKNLQESQYLRDLI